MNKKAIRIAGWALGLSLAVAGIGAAVSTKRAVETKAAGKSDWVRITSFDDLNTSDKFVLATGNTTYDNETGVANTGKYFNGSQSDGHLSSSSFGSSAPDGSSSSTAGVFKLEAIDATNTANHIFNIKLVSTSKYVYATKASSGGGSTTGDGKTSGKEGTSGWKFLNSSGTWNAIYQKSYSSKYAALRCYNNETFRTYQNTSSSSVTTTSGTGFQIYKYVAPASLSSIEVKTAPKASYYAGDYFDPTGLVITATFSNSTTTDIPYEGNEDKFTFSPNLTTTLTQSDEAVAIRYGGKSTDFPIAVSAARTVTGIAFTGNMTNKEYSVGDSWDYSGLGITVTYDSGDPDSMTLAEAVAASKIVISSSPAAPASDTTSVTISITSNAYGYGGVITPKVVDGISIVLADVLNSTNLGLPNSYGNFSGRTKAQEGINSDTTYAGNAMKGTSSSIQLNGTSRGIYATAADTDKYISKVTVDFVDANSKTLYVYGRNTPYTGILSSNFGTKLAEISANGSVSITAGQFSYVYIYSSGAMYMATIKIQYSDFVPTITLSGTDVDMTVGDTGTIEKTITPAHLKNATYSAVSSDKSVIADEDISIAGTTLTIDKEDVNAGSTTITVSAKVGGVEKATASFEVLCAAANRSLVSIAKTTNASDVEFEKGTPFTIGGLVITGTFDAAPINENVTSACAYELWNAADTAKVKDLVVGTTALDTAGNYTVHASLTPASEIVKYTIEVYDVVSLSLTGTKIGSFNYGTTQSSSFDVTLAGSTSIDSSVDMESSNFYKNGNNIQSNVSNKGAAHIRNTIAVPGKIARIVMTWTATGANPHVYFANAYISSKPASGGILGDDTQTTQTIVPSGDFSYFYFDAPTVNGASVMSEFRVVYRATGAGVAKNFADKYLHMNDYSSESNYCKDGEHHYYLTAKAAYNDLSSAQKTEFDSLTAAKARYEKWAIANNDAAPYDGNDTVVSKIHANLANLETITSGSTIPLVATIATLGAGATVGFFLFQRKRKEI